MAEKDDAEKLHLNLNTILAKHCHEMPQLSARLAGEYPTNEEALDQVEKMSDKAFSESANDEISCMHGVLAFDLEQLN